MDSLQSNIKEVNLRIIRLPSIFFILGCMALPLSLEAAESNDIPELKKAVEDLKKEVADLKKPAPATLIQNQDMFATLQGATAIGFNKPHHRNSAFDVVDFNPIFLVTYQESFLLRTAVDFSINTDGSTDVSLDFANINWFIHDYIALGAGKSDSEIGQFTQNLSPRWINKLPTVPVGFDGDQAAPQSEIGTYLRGGCPIGDTMQANYALFVANAPRAMVDTTNSIVDHISTDGFTSKTDNYIQGGRIGFLPVASIEVGISGAIGRLPLYDSANTSTQLEKNRGYSALGIDFNTQYQGLNFRGEAIQQLVKKNLNSSSAVASGKWKAWYLQLAYRHPSIKWEPVIRCGNHKTPFIAQNQKQSAIGLNYWFTPSIVTKFAYEFNKGQSDTDNNSNVLFVQFVLGF